MFSVEPTKLINYISFKINPRHCRDLETYLREKRNIFKKLLKITKIKTDTFEDKKPKFIRQQSYNNYKVIEHSNENKKTIKYDFIIKRKDPNSLINRKKNEVYLNSPTIRENFSPKLFSNRIKYVIKERLLGDEIPTEKTNKINDYNNSDKNDEMKKIKSYKSRIKENNIHTSVNINLIENIKKILPNIQETKRIQSPPLKNEITVNNNPMLKQSSSFLNYKHSNVRNKINTQSLLSFKKTLFENKKSSLMIMSNDKNLNTSKEQNQRNNNHNLILPTTLNQIPTTFYESSPVNILSHNQPNKYHYTITRFYREQFKQYFSHRINWKLVNSSIEGTININFQWKFHASHATILKCKYESSLTRKKLRMINLFEHNYELGNKKKFFINIIKYCDKNNINVFDLIPFTIILSNNKYFEYGSQCFEEIFTYLNEHYNEYSKLNQDKITLNRLYKDQFHFDLNYTDCTNTYINFPISHTSNKNYWILKPIDLYQGKCIEILNKFQDIIHFCHQLFKGVDKFKKIENLNTNKSLLYLENEKEQKLRNEEESPKKKQKHKIYCSNDIIIQKYLDNPFLYNKRKFDIRCYVLVDHNLNVFYCREGHLKGSSEKYDLNVNNKFIHITNHSLQKKSANFEKYEFGNEMSYQDFKNFLQDEKISLDSFDKLVNEIKYLIEISMKSIGKKLIANEKILSFEIFGYDFIIDNKFKPWILEINNNPGLGISSPVIEKLIPRMLDDAFRLTIDTVFETVYDESVFDKENKVYKTKYHLDGFNDNENIFEFICNIMNS